MSSVYPPMYPGALSPDEILGHQGLTNLVQHYKKAREYKLDTLDDAVRDKAAEGYKLLRDKGWYLFGIDGRGRPMWRYVVDSRPREIRDMPQINEDGEPVDGVFFSREECEISKKAANVRSNRTVVGMPKCKPWDYDSADSGR